MTSKILWTLALYGGVDSLPINGSSHGFTTSLLAHLVSPVNQTDPGTGFLLSCGLLGLIVMRRWVR